MIKSDTLLAHTITGGLAGLTAECCTHPIDTVRTRLQNQRGNSVLRSNFLKSKRNFPLIYIFVVNTIFGHQGEYTGTFSTLRRIFVKEGVSGLFGGFTSVAFFTLPAHAFYFSGYEMTKSILQPNKPPSEKSPWVHFTAGIVADILGALIWTPQDILKQRFQILPPEKRTSLFEAAKEIYKTNGVRGFYQGFNAGIATYAPYVGIYFVVYEQFKRLSISHFKLPSELHLPFYHSLIFGGLSAVIAGGATCPFDVIKTRIQIQNSSSQMAYTGIFHAFKTIAKEEGFSAFFKGLTARILWLAPSSAITMLAYEQLKKYLTYNYNDDNNVNNGDKTIEVK